MLICGGCLTDELQDQGAVVHGHIFADEEESEATKPDPPTILYSGFWGKTIILDHKHK